MSGKWTVSTDNVLRYLRLPVVATSKHCAPSNQTLTTEHCPRLHLNPAYCTLFGRVQVWDEDLPLRLSICLEAEATK